MAGKAANPSWQWLPSPHRRVGRRSEVTGIVQHYTGGGNGRALARWLAGPDAKVSAHVITCRDGHIIQQVSFTDEAWHAGEKQSVGLWKGKPQPENVNRFTIGIENSNYGWLLRDEEGKFWLKRRTKTGYRMHKPYAGPMPVRLADHQGTMRWWEPFSDAQVEANIEVVKRICEVYPNIARDDVQDHSSISPHRKFDPGPAWPAGYVLDSVFGSGASRVDVAPAFIEEPKDYDFEFRDYYDEDLDRCIEPELR